MAGLQLEGPLLKIADDQFHRAIEGEGVAGGWRTRPGRFGEDQQSLVGRCGGLGQGAGLMRLQGPEQGRQPGAKLRGRRTGRFQSQEVHRRLGAFSTRDQFAVSQFGAGQLKE